MPSRRPFSHSPPSEIGVSFRGKSVLYDLTGDFFGKSIMGPLPSTLPWSEHSKRPSSRLFGRSLLTFPDDVGCLRQPRFIPAQLHPGHDDDAEKKPNAHDQRRP